MTEQRFRFRIPWLSAAPQAPRPVTPLSPLPPPPPPPPPAAPEPEPAQPMQPVGASITQRPQFRPPGIASPLRSGGQTPPRSPRFQPQFRMTSPPVTPPQTPPRSRTTSLSPPPFSPDRLATMEPPSPPPPPTAVAPPPPPPQPLAPPPSPPPPPPPPQQYQEQTESSHTMVAKLPSAKALPETPRTIHQTHRQEQVKDMREDDGEKRPEDEKGPLKGDKAKKGPKHHQAMAKEEKKKATPIPSSQEKHRFRTLHHLHAPAGSSSPSIGQEPSLQKGIKEDVTKLVQKLTTGHPTKPDQGQIPVHVITLAGENQGASMQLSSESSYREKGTVHIHRGYKTNPDESMDPTTDEGEQVAAPGEDAALPSTEEDPNPETYINSNVQGVNNSVMFEGSMTERNPGVHVTMLAEEKAELLPERGGKEELTDTRRSEFSPTPAERLTYQPVIRRRCLRGLFMESSDTDTDDPAKPRRHGCRYGCGERSKDKDINVL